MKRRPTLLDYAVNNIPTESNESTLRQALSSDSKSETDRTKSEGSDNNKTTQKRG